MDEVETQLAKVLFGVMTLEVPSCPVSTRESKEHEYQMMVITSGTEAILLSERQPRHRVPKNKFKP